MSKQPREFIRVALFLTPAEYDDLDTKQPMRTVAMGEGMWRWIRERMGWHSEPYGWNSLHKIITESEYIERRKG